jgi:hypothetical protein
MDVPIFPLSPFPVGVVFVFAPERMSEDVKLGIKNMGTVPIFLLGTGLYPCLC